MAFLPERGNRFALVSFFQLAFVVMQTQVRPYVLDAENRMAFVSYRMIDCCDRRLTIC